MLFTTITSLGIIAIQAVTIAFVFLWWKKHPVLKTVYAYAPSILALLFIFSVLGSLIFEYGLGFEPCLLCWYQRIAIFGVAILSLSGDIRTNKTLQKQLIIFTGLGLIVALFHNYIDIFPTGLDVCGTGASCLKRYIHEFGYITIPMMSLSVLFAGFVLGLFLKKYKPENTTHSQESLSQ